MSNQIGLILKVILLSLILSFLIKYGREDFLIPGTASNALILVLSPTVILGSLLGLRFVMDRQE
jgi:type III secretory pathway component EscU